MSCLPMGDDTSEELVIAGVVSLASSGGQSRHAVRAWLLEHPIAVGLRLLSSRWQGWGKQPACRQHLVFSLGILASRWKDGMNSREEGTNSSVLAGPFRPP